MATDPDKMVPLGGIPTRDGGIVRLHRDYEDLMFGDFRFTPEAAASLEGKIAEWRRQADDYARQMDEQAQDEADWRAVG